MKYLVIAKTEAVNFSEQLWNLIRPDPNPSDVTNYYFAITDHPTDPTAVLGYYDDSTTVYLDGDLSTTGYQSSINNLIPTYCTTSDRDTVITYINSNLGSAVLLSAIIPATIWSGRLTQAGADAAGYFAGIA